MNRVILREKRSPYHYIFKFGVLLVLLAGFATYGFISKTAISGSEIFSNQTIGFESAGSTLFKLYDHDDDDECKYVKFLSHVL